MTDETPDQQIELREYLGILRARKWTVIAATVLVLAGALTYSYSQTPLYTARTRVLVNSAVSDPEAPLLSAPVDLATEREILASEKIASQVREELGLKTSLTNLLGPLKVTGLTETRVLQVTYESPDPKLSQQLAQAFSAQYLDYRREQALKAVQSSQEGVQGQIDDTSEQLNQINRDIVDAQDTGVERTDEAGSETTEPTANEATIESLEATRNTLLARLGVLQQQLADLQPTQNQLAVGDIIEAAKLPTEQSSPDYLRTGILGGFLGLLLGAGLAFLRERLDDRFRGRSDVEAALGAPVLATVPRFTLAGKKKEREESLVVARAPQSLAAEAYRSLRTNLRFIATQREVSTLLVTSAGVGEGKTVTSANLAIALAQSGLQVVLVSGDLRRPTIEKYFGLDGDEGFSTWFLSGADDWWNYLRDPGIPNLRVLPAGPLPPNPAEILGSHRFGQLLTALKANADFVVIDSPPVIPVADPAIVAGRADGVLLVLDANSTHRSVALRAKQELERAGGHVVGTLLNAFDPQSSPYSYYDSPYYYAHATGYAAERDRDGNGAGPMQKKARRMPFGLRK